MTGVTIVTSTGQFPCGNFNLCTGSVEATHTPPQLPQHPAINPRTNSRGQLVLPLPISYHQLFSGIVQLLQVHFVAQYSTIRGEKRQERQKSKLLLVSSSWAQNIWKFTFVIRGNLIRGQHGDLAVNLSVCRSGVQQQSVEMRCQELKEEGDPREGGGRSP